MQASRFFLYHSFVFLLLLFVPTVFAADLPYIGQASDRTLEATHKARKILLSERSKMRSWTTEQWQAWAEERFGINTSADGSTWQDWRKARIKSSADHTVLPGLEQLNKSALHWDADDWMLFVDNIDTDYQSSGKYISVILPNGQDRGAFLLGRWAYAMYENNLLERSAWESSLSDDGSGSGVISDEDLQQIKDLCQMNLEVLSFVAGLLSALLVAVTWRYR